MKELYYENQYISEFDAVVVSCEKTEDGLFAVVLDETAFFPEQGGQYADEGKISGIDVRDVKKIGEDVVHFLAEPLSVGAEVTGAIDFDKRFDRMQQHSGEHVISGVLHNLFGYENVGFHLSDEEMTMDTSGELSDEEIQTVERIANEIVFRNLPVTATYPTPEEAEKMQFRSKKEIVNGLRLVSIGDIDTCACCAPHVSSTGEIGLIKILRSMRWKGGMRLFVACGRRALLDYSEKSETVKKISVLTNVKQTEISDAVSELLEKISENKKEIKELNMELCRAATDSIPENSGRVAIKLNSDTEVLRAAVNNAVGKAEAVFAYSGSDENGYNFVFGSEATDFADFSKKLLSALNGRGGGRGNMISGTVKATEAEIKAFFS